MNKQLRATVLWLCACCFNFTLLAIEDTELLQKPQLSVNETADYSISKAVSDDKQNTIVIESRVTGSQEQPKVLYIMPWQGIKTPILIDGKKRTIVMPKFKPISRKEFKKQVRVYYQQHK